MSDSLNLKKCPSCGQWTPSKLDRCEHCGFEIHKQRREELAERRKIADIGVPIWRIHDSDPVWLKIVKRPIQFVQLILYAIIGFLIYLSTSLAH